jgi:hypothetical protein
MPQNEQQRRARIGQFNVERNAKFIKKYQSERRLRRSAPASHQHPDVENSQGGLLEGISNATRSAMNAIGMDPRDVVSYKFTILGTDESYLLDMLQNVLSNTVTVGEFGDRNYKYELDLYVEDDTLQVIKNNPNLAGYLDQIQLHGGRVSTVKEGVDRAEANLYNVVQKYNRDNNFQPGNKDYVDPQKIPSYLQTEKEFYRFYLDGKLFSGAYDIIRQFLIYDPSHAGKPAISIRMETDALLDREPKPKVLQAAKDGEYIFTSWGKSTGFPQSSGSKESFIDNNICVVDSGGIGLYKHNIVMSAELHRELLDTQCEVRKTKSDSPTTVPFREILAQPTDSPWEFKTDSLNKVVNKRVKEYGIWWGACAAHALKPKNVPQISCFASPFVFTQVHTPKSNVSIGD